MKRFLVYPLILAMLASSIVFATGTAFAGTPMSGAIWTTDSDGSVNINLYDAKDKVWLNGGPIGGQQKGLPDGEYYVKVTEPAGAMLGKSTGTVTVVDGRFATAVRLVDFVKTTSSGYTAFGYDDTTNNGGEYKVWLSKNPAFPNDESKTDNFKVKDDVKLVTKVWRASVPGVLLNLVPDVEFWVFYSSTDPATPDVDIDWVHVQLAREDNTLVFSATTVHELGETIWFWWLGTGTGYEHKSDVSSEVLIPATPGAPIENAYTYGVAFKDWALYAPQLEGVNYYAAYSIDQETWTPEEELRYNPDGYFEATNVIPTGLTIYWKWIAKKGGEVWWESNVLGPETLTGDASNSYELVLKTWMLHTGAMMPPVDATAWASWSDDNGSTWNDVQLQQSNGTWSAMSLFPVETSIKWRFFLKIGDAEMWSSGVNGPETLMDDMTNHGFYGGPRTIGYWMNWRNHFSQTSMDAIVAQVNSDAGGFSSVFKSGAAGDTGWYMLRSGTNKKTSAVGDVAYWLGEAQNAKSMYQMLRAQLLGLELNVAIAQAGQMPNNGDVVGISPSASVYLTKLPGYTSDPTVNPWATEVVTVGQVIGTIEAASANNWVGWSRAKQEFAKNVCDSINNFGHGGPADVSILEP
ncbi:MAG: hypothetical protein Q8K99_05745 [Actinomycetota bacterium]|nr:hypothetical protein [Actinomycetota bacterium]